MSVLTMSAAPTMHTEERYHNSVGLLRLGFSLTGVEFISLKSPALNCGQWQ